MERMSASFDGTLDDLWNYVLSYSKVAEPYSVVLGGIIDKSHLSIKLDLRRWKKLTKEEMLDRGIPADTEWAEGDRGQIGSIELVRVTEKRAELICQTETDDAEQWCSGLIQKMEREELAVDTVKRPGRSRRPREAAVNRMAYAMMAEDIMRLDKDATRDEIIREIGWPFGKTPGSKRTMLTTARQKLADLYEFDPEGILEEAKERYQELKRKSKIME